MLGSIISESYIQNADSSSSFESNVVDLIRPVSAIGYQFKWDVGVRGTLTWKAAIFEGEWDDLVACEKVEYVVDGTTTQTIIALPHIWLAAGFIKVVWTPNLSGSVGYINAAIRIVPV
jgi:hypothetical protein